MNITSINIRERGASDTWQERKAAPRCYVFPHGETVLDNLTNRRYRPYEAYRAEVLPTVAKAVADRLGIPADCVKFRWSQKAGCGCGCSPGFVLTTPFALGLFTAAPSGFDVYVDVTS